MFMKSMAAANSLTSTNIQNKKEAVITEKFSQLFKSI